jgi:gibberellin A4 carboxyl methyltransferase
MAFQQHSLSDYNNNSSWQLSVNLSKLDHFVSTVLPLFSSSSPIHIADYGCSEVANSMAFFNSAIPRLRQTGTHPPVTITHIDLPSNNWSLVNDTLISSANSYLHHYQVYFNTIGRSFFQQLLPNGSVNIAYSAFSFHYLSVSPQKPEGESHFYHSGIPLQGVADMKKLINLRLAELVEGGVLFAIIGCHDDDESIVLRDIIMQTFAKMIQNGVISDEELTRLEWNTYLLKKNEWEEVLAEVKDKAEVISFSSEKSVSPQYVKYLEDNDKEAYIDGLCGYLMVLMRVMMLRCLQKNDQEKDAFLKEFERIIKETIAEHLGEPYFHFVTLVLQKKKS